MSKRVMAMVLALVFAVGCATGGHKTRSSHSMSPAMVGVLVVTIGVIAVAAAASKSEPCTLAQCVRADYPAGPPER